MLPACGKSRPIDSGQLSVTAKLLCLADSDPGIGWSAKTQPLPNGVLLTVTSSDPRQVQHTRGLGFIGFMASGSHRQAHHLAMAKGEFFYSQRATSKQSA